MERRKKMYLMNYHLYANKAALPQIMAEDTGAAELRNPVFYIRTEYRLGKIRRTLDRLARSWSDFWNAPSAREICRCDF